MELYTPVTEHMKVDMRMNLKTKKVELKSSKRTPDAAALQKCADFVQAFVLGFEPADALALLRLDDLYVECFEVKDVKQASARAHPRPHQQHNSSGAILHPRCPPQPPPICTPSYTRATAPRRGAQRATTGTRARRCASSCGGAT